MDIKNLGDLFRNLPKIYGDRTYMVYRNTKEKKWEELTAKQAYEKARYYAMGLYELGFRKGDKLCLMSETSYQWTLLDFAMVATGVINVPIYPTLTDEQAKYIIEHAESKGLIVYDKRLLKLLIKYKDEHKLLKYIIINGEADKENNVITLDDVEELGKKYYEKNGDSIIEETLNNIDENEMASILYTSGTTGTPKGVMLSHKNFVSNAGGAERKLSLGKYNKTLVFLPLSHSFARSCNYGLMMGGETLWYAESVSTLARDLVDSQTETLITVPRVFENVYRKIISGASEKGKIAAIITNWAKGIAEKYTYKKQRNQKISAFLKFKHNIADKLVYSKIRQKTGGKLSLVVSGASAFPKHILYFFNGMGIPIMEGYGLTEATPVVSTNTPEQNKIGTVGTPFDNVEVKLDDDNELLVKGPSVMMGYYKDEASTNETITEDGWLRTGDICELDSENYIRIIERKKDLFKTSNGKFIVPQKIESIAKMNNLIEEFVVIADNRKFASALILPDFKELKKYAKEKNIAFNDNKDLVDKQEVQKLYRKLLDETINPHLAMYEIIRKFILIDQPFTIENGELTPSLKVKRKAVNKHYEKEINKLYGNNMD